MVGGVGYAAGRAGAKRAAQEQQPAGTESQQAPPSAPPPAPAETVVEQLQKLGQLRDSGVLTSEEFEAQKQKILASGGG
ncbi:MAG: SHOCT domain-containing protein [Solirubrobacteraceae bacterium]